MGMKEQIDIEALLVWAYRNQCVDRAQVGFKPRGPNGSISNALAQHMALGTRVDTSGYAARALGDRTPPDALIIHDHVLALGDMWIEWDGEDVRLWDAASAAEAGCEIGKAGGDWLLTRDGRMQARLDQAGAMALVIQHGREATRPDWCEGWKRAGGRPASDAAERDVRGRKRRRGEGISQREVQYQRALYHVWRSAMALLALQLDGVLAGYVVSGPAAPEAPWLSVSDRGAEKGSECQNSMANNSLELQS